MLSESASVDDFLANPESKKWIVHCVICGRYGRNPNSPVSQLPRKFQELFPSLTVTPDRVCQVCLPSYNARREKTAILDVLNNYVQEHGCPCNWEKFEFWVSKEWGCDEYQNILADAAVNLSCFERNVIRPDYDIKVVCKHCGSKWHYTSHERTMMMYCNRFVPDSSRTFDYNLKVLTGISFEQWYEFMQGKPYAGVPVTIRLEPIKAL